MTRARDDAVRDDAKAGREDACERGTGWTYCRHAGLLAVCRCSCTCLDQQHCGRPA